MLRFVYFLSLFVFLSSACTAAPAPTQVATEPPTPKPQDTQSPTLEVTETADVSELPDSALVDVYDPSRDPAADLQQAIQIAQRENKRILLELGGDWCIWCKYMDEFYATHPDILQFRAEHYVLVKINVSDQNMNEGFLSQYPDAAGYPHIYVLESDGTFLHSQDTVELEDGAISYVPEVFMGFLQEWAPLK